MADHAKLSPSAAARWSRCPGSIRASQGYKDTSGLAAIEGTRAHALLEWGLMNPERDLAEYGETTDHWGTWEPDKEMIDHITRVRQQILDLAGGAIIHTERQVEIGVHLGLEPGTLWGTSDVIIEAGDTLIVVDLKYGRKPVSPVGNEQMVLYGVGALGELENDEEVDYDDFL